MKKRVYRERHKIEEKMIQKKEETKPKKKTKKGDK